jgi:hypothetical protein
LVTIGGGWTKGSPLSGHFGRLAANVQDLAVGAVIGAADRFWPSPAPMIGATDRWSRTTAESGLDSGFGTAS